MSVEPAARIRVAFCLDSFAIGGTELNAVRTAEALDPGRIELSVFYLQAHGALRPRYERLGVPMTHVPIPNLYSPRTVAQGARLASALRRARADVAHSHDIYCNIFAVPWARAFTSCAVVASRRWGRQASRSELSTANRLCTRLAHCVLSNSEAVAELMAGEEGVARARIVTIPNFLSEEAFEVAHEPDRQAQRRAWGVPDGAFAIGIVARLSPVKNHALLLEALARLDERCHLVAIGDGPLRAALGERAATLGIASRVHFTGELVAGRNLAQFLDASVLCSLSEGFPNSLIEAMAAGRPVVATPVGGVIDAVRDGDNGLLVPLGDPAPLARALGQLAAEPALRARLGEAARETARLKYRREPVIEKLTALYEELAGRRAASRLESADA